MRNYHRILVRISAGGQGDILLHRAAELAQGPARANAGGAVLDTRSGFEPDGPAAMLPGETACTTRAGRQESAWNLQLARNNLGWAEAKVVWGEPQAMLADVIRSLGTGSRCCVRRANCPTGSERRGCPDSEPHAACSGAWPEAWHQPDAPARMTGFRRPECSRKTRLDAMTRLR